ncbi:MAG: hypothetical protein ACHP7N_11770 [Caulobacterales bacterium]
MITKLVATLGVAAMALSIAGSASALNPQPLPPKCHPNGRCPPRGVVIRPMMRHHHCVIRHHQRHCWRR